MQLPVVDLCLETKVWEAMRRRQQKSSIELMASLAAIGLQLKLRLELGLGIRLTNKADQITSTTTSESHLKHKIGHNPSITSR